MDNFGSITPTAAPEEAMHWDKHFKVLYYPAQAILEHAGFPAARTAYFDQLEQLYGGNPFVNKLMMQAGRMVLFLLIICLHAGYDEADRSTWPTLGNLQRALQGMGLASGGHIEQLVSRLLHVGFLEARRSPVDGRVRLLAPTAAMLAHDQDWLIAHYAPLAALFGAERYRRPMFRDAGFQVAQRCISAANFAALAAPLLDNPIIFFFARHDAAFLILTSLARAANRSGGEIAMVPYAELARRFAVSRTHVRRLLHEAEAQGWVRLEGATRREVTLLPALRHGLDRFIAESMSNHDRTGQAAELVCDAERGADRMLPPLGG